MAVEIERKFLVEAASLPELRNGVFLRQGYLHSSPEKTIRLRITADKAWLTIKGATSGISRAEFEYEIPLNEANAMWPLCGSQSLEKTRYKIPVGNHTFEVDVFHGRHDGLILAEVELQSEDEEFIKPKWLGKEVSHDHQYTNAALAKK